MPVRLLLDAKTPRAERAADVGLTIGKVITRGAPYVLRIAATYAAVESAHAIEPKHLAAAREVWRYSMDSAHHRR